MWDYVHLPKQIDQTSFHSNAEKKKEKEGSTGKNKKEQRSK